ncbi:MAG: helix-turn-helix domain-containing protein [Pseudomonadota bacterium]
MIHTKPRYTIPEAADLLGFSRAYLYSRIAHGRIKVTKDGTRSFIDAGEIDRYTASCAAGERQAA